MSYDMAVARGERILLGEGTTEVLTLEQSRDAANKACEVILRERCALALFNPSEIEEEELDNEDWAEHLSSLMSMACALAAVHEARGPYKSIYSLVRAYSQELRVYKRDICFVLDGSNLVQNWEAALGQRRYQFWWTSGELEACRGYAQWTADSHYPFEYTDLL